MDASTPREFARAPVGLNVGSVVGMVVEEATWQVCEKYVEEGVPSSLTPNIVLPVLGPQVVTSYDSTVGSKAHWELLKAPRPIVDPEQVYSTPERHLSAGTNTK